MNISVRQCCVRWWKRMRVLHSLNNCSLLICFNVYKIQQTTNPNPVTCELVNQLCQPSESRFTCTHDNIFQKTTTINIQSFHNIFYHENYLYYREKSIKTTALYCSESKPLTCSHTSYKFCILVTLPPVF